MEMLTVLTLVIALGALGFSIFVFLQIRSLLLRFNTALGQGETAPIEHMLATHLKTVNSVSERLEHLNHEYEQLAVSNSLASQKISIVRYNPFGDTGGDQSFTLAVLDAHDSGYVLTSIHGRQGTRMYIKPVDFGKSKHTLSAEEKQAIGQAIKRVPNLKEQE
jgi:Protein of unknown function (DUF4446)